MDNTVFTSGIVEKEKQLFKEWAEKRKGFSPDGIIDETYYFESKPKLLFLMKEVNSEKGFDLKQFVKNGGRARSWNNIARWIFGIRNLSKELKWTELKKIKTDEQRKQLFKSICIMNLKKSPGSSTTVNKELSKIAEEDKEFLNRQIQIYLNDLATRPDLIIACGSVTSDTFNALVTIQNASEWKTTSRGIWYYEYEKNRFFIDYSHPEARVQDSLLYYGLIDAIKELTTK